MPYSFCSDYSEGMHPRLLQALAETNMEQAAGYGADVYSQRAADCIRALCAAPQAHVHFLSGGTQTNLVLIHAALSTVESVIATSTAHICVNECASIQAAGHRLETVEPENGKLTPKAIEATMRLCGRENRPLPKLAYISNTVENGCAYTLEELQQLRLCCDRHGLYLYCDGARLGFALETPHGAMSFRELSACLDAFSIGGTKNGALLGEALVINNDTLKANFRWHQKQRGALLSKGRLFGVQFFELFRDGLYGELSRHANAMAMRIRAGLADKGFVFASESESNQQFVFMHNGVIAKITQRYGLSVRGSSGETHSLVRICTSWATPEEETTRFIEYAGRCKAETAQKGKGV